MKAFISTSEKFYVRSLLLVSVLVALCVSEGVGLQLLPIPNAPIIPVCSTEAILLEVPTDLPDTPSQSKNISGRVEIVAPKMDVSHQDAIQIYTVAVLTRLYIDDSFSYTLSSSEVPISDYSGIFICKSTSRAPPLA